MTETISEKNVIDVQFGDQDVLASLLRSCAVVHLYLQSMICNMKRQLLLACRIIMLCFFLVFSLSSKIILGYFQIC